MQIRDRIKELRRVPARDLIPNRKNWRKHPKAQADAMREILESIGYAGALLAREEKGKLHLIDGHMRTETTPDAIVPVLVLDVTAAEADTILATFDPLSAMAVADSAKLEELMAGMTIGEGALAEMMKGVRDTAKEMQDMAVTEDEAPAPLPDPVSKTGDLWLMGEHRLLCGDSTIEADVVRLMNGKRAEVMNTDPPYGVAYGNEERPNPGVAKPRVANDTLADEVLQAFLEKCFRAAVSHALKENAAWYLWHAHLTQGFFAAAAAAAANVVLHRQIIWVKPVLLLTRGQYHWQHEPCFFGWVEGHQPPDFGSGGGERNQTTIWEIGGIKHAERKELNHATPKPVELFTIPIVKHTRAGAVVYEPFSGSGPQIIAAEQLARKCYAIEIEPRYVDVAIRRWQKLTGKAATHSETGKTWEQTAKARGVTTKEPTA